MYRRINYEAGRWKVIGGFVLKDRRNSVLSLTQACACASSSRSVDGDKGSSEAGDGFHTVDAYRWVGVGILFGCPEVCGGISYSIVN